MSLAAASPMRPRSPRGGGALRLGLAAFYIAILAPLFGLAFLAWPTRGVGAGALWSPAAALTFRETLILLAGTGLLSSAIGVGAAWIVAMYRFPGRGALALLLVLPLALPTYLAAYVAVELTEYYGPLQGALRWALGYTSRRDYWFFDMRSLAGAILVFSLALYPYVYLPARLMFERQGSNVIQAARLHGSRGWRLFLRIGVPLARPAIVGGAAFVLIETLNDIGAVEHLGVQSISLTIRAIWLNRGNLPGAAQFALVGLILVLAILFLEHALRRAGSYAGSARRGGELQPIRLRGRWAALAVIACLIPICAGFAAPAAFLLFEAIGVIARKGVGADIARALGNSLLLSVGAALIVAVLGALVALAARLLPSSYARQAPRLGALGYAIPGTVLVIALLPVLALVDDGLETAGLRLVVSGSMAAILVAYVIRFAGLGVAQAEAGLARLSPNIDHAARTLGGNLNRLAFQVLAPNMRRAMGLAVLLVMVDAMKELPATLLLRPLNVETLATSLYGHASAGSFENGAVEALLLLAIGIVPAAFLARAR
jgi:iron(III) transport system permease protein